MEPWWRPVLRFLLRLAIVCAAPLVLVAVISLWKSYGLAEFGVALAVAGIVIMALGLLPLLLLPSSFQRFGPWGGGAASNLSVLTVAQLSEMTDPDDMLRQDIEDRETSAPLTVLLLAAGLIFMLAGWGLEAVG